MSFGSTKVHIMFKEEFKSSWLVESRLPTKHGLFDVLAFKSEFHTFPHIVLKKGDISSKEIIDVRIHSECMTGDVFSSLRCECGDQLDFSMNWIQNHGGLLIYLRQEGRGIGLVNKLKAYNLQDKGLNTKEANLTLGFHSDLRTYEVAVDILRFLKVGKIRLLTNNPEKIDAFKDSGVTIIDRIPIEISPSAENLKYLKTKKVEMGHLLTKLND